MTKKKDKTNDFEEFLTLQWVSPYEIPPVGTELTVRFGQKEKVKVESYFVEFGYIGVAVESSQRGLLFLFPNEIVELYGGCDWHNEYQKRRDLKKVSNQT